MVVKVIVPVCEKTARRRVYDMTEIARGYLTDYLNFGVVMNGRNNLVKKLR